MIKYFIMLIITSGLISQEKDFSSNIEPLLVEELSDLELMLIADINTNSTLKKFFELNVINESIQLNAPIYDRFAMKNNIGMLLPLNTSSSIYLDAGIEGWMEANKYISNNNSMYSRGFFNSSTDNFFKDPWDQRAIDDYIRYLHTSPSLKHSEINTIYDRNR